MSGKQIDNVVKSVIVTGAASGIGREIAATLVAEGWQVIVADLDGSLAAEVAERINALSEAARAAGPGAAGLAIAETLDVASEASVSALFARLKETTSGLPSALVNNAGIQTWSPLLELDLADWNHTLAVNLTGCFLMSREFGRHLTAANSPGAIVNLGSGCNKLAFPNLVDYTASKGGIEMFTKSAALEFGQFGIRVNCVAPGAIETERTRQETGNYAASWGSLTPLGRVGQSADVAAAVSFLIGPGAEFISGQTLAVDGALFSQSPWPRDY